MGNASCRPALPRRAEPSPCNGASREACEIKFPMHVVPLDVFLSLCRLKPFQELLQEGALIKFHAQLGNVIFVSHQWLKKRHPDPYFQQTRVLQEALRNLLSGRVRLEPEVSLAELQAKPLFLWYDYISCPQLLAANDDPSVVASLHNAVDSIPGYVQQSTFFVILAPPVQHLETGSLLGYESWQARGWCRLERAARSLALEAMVAPIVVEGPKTLHMAPHVQTMLQPVGKGEFRSENDKAKAASLLESLVSRKLQFYRDIGDVRRYRMLLSTKHIYLQDLPMDDDGARRQFSSHTPAVSGRRASALQQTLVARRLAEHGDTLPPLDETRAGYVMISQNSRPLWGEEHGIAADARAGNQKDGDKQSHETCGAGHVAQ
mmetsp:Transcript_36354/g.83851  ORF Transcript_36354/g.83851 Transcript_36354/m.83851 type:complete len:377 (-) Transcript_36354:224-1354(-)